MSDSNRIRHIREQVLYNIVHISQSMGLKIADPLYLSYTQSKADLKTTLSNNF